MTQRNTWRIIVLRRAGEPSTGSGRTYGDAGTSLPNGSPTSSGTGEPPRAFTLVELLVVIGILALLAALLVPTVMTALRTTRNAAIRSEINMLQMAMLNYQSEYGVLPPCTEGTGGSRLPARHLRRLFPRCPNVDQQLNQPGAVSITPQSALVSWLGGFTPDPTSPLLPPAARVRLYDFDRLRIDPATLAYHPSGSKNSPFIYIDAAHYKASTASPRFSAGPSGEYFAHRVPKAPMWSFEDPTDTQPFFNEDTFQILCAGRDGVFGNDDDLSNFWPGTRRDYLDSLR